MAARCLMTSVGESSCLAPKYGVLKQLGAEILKVSRWTLGTKVMSTFLLTGSQGPRPSPILRRPGSSSLWPKLPRVSDNRAWHAPCAFCLASPKSKAVRP